MNIKHIARPNTDPETRIRGFKSLNSLVADAAPIKNATDRTVKIHEIVETVTLQLLANVGSVGPVTLKNKPIAIRAPTIAAMKHLNRLIIKVI